MSAKNCSGGKKTTCAIHKQEQLQQKSTGQIALLFEIMTVNIKHLFMSQQTRTLSISLIFNVHNILRGRERENHDSTRKDRSNHQ